MKRKIILLSLAALFLQRSASACDACKKQQAKFLQGISHGPGPDSNWDYLIVAVMVAFTLYILAATIRCIFRPREDQAQHIKRMVLNNPVL